MTYGSSKATPEEIEQVVAKLCKLYPKIPEADHRMIADITYDNYFSKKGIFYWYNEIASKLTPKVLKGIRDDPHTFFYAESHLCKAMYTPLADRTDI